MIQLLHLPYIVEIITDNTSSTKYDLLKYQVGINAYYFVCIYEPRSKLLMGPALILLNMGMSVDTKYTTVNAVSRSITMMEDLQIILIYREHYSVNVGFLARFSEKINMNMFITFGYKKDTYSEKDPYG